MRAAAAGLVLVAAAVTTACGPSGVEPPEVTAAAAAAPTAPTTPAPTGTPSALGAAAGAHGLFIDLVAAACTGTAPEGTAPIPDAERAGVSSGPDTETKGIWAVTDAEGRVLLIDTRRRQVTGDRGPEGPLPAVYAAVCDDDVFVGDGSAADGGDIEADAGAGSVTETP